MKQDKNATRPSGVSRRTVVKGAAWAVPAITVASAVPAVASSGEFLTLTGSGCKQPGNSQSNYKGYVFKLTASNTTSSPVTITITSVFLGANNLGPVTVLNLNPCDILGNPFTLAAGTTLANLVLITTNAPNSQNNTLTVNYTLATDPTTTLTATATAGSTPPIQGACAIFTPAEEACIATV